MDFISSLNKKIILLDNKFSTYEQILKSIDLLFTNLEKSNSEVVYASTLDELEDTHEKDTDEINWVKRREVFFELSEDSPSKNLYLNILNHFPHTDTFKELLKTKLINLDYIVISDPLLMNLLKSNTEKDKVFTSQGHQGTDARKIISLLHFGDYS